MNEWLAQYFGTAPVSEETTKQAHAELFVKLAMENGIDLNAMSEAEVAELYESTMGKMAEEGASEEYENRKKVEEAKKEHEEKKAAAQEFEAKFAEAQFMGQTMAHAFTAELEAIEQQKVAMGRVEIGARARGLVSRAKDVGKKIKDVATAGEYRRGRALSSKVESGEVGRRVENVLRGHGVTPSSDSRFGEAKKMMIDAASESAKKHQRAGLAKTVGLYGGGAAAVGAGAAGIHHATKEKKSSALDELAADVALAKVAEAGWDVDEAADRLTAVLTLGVDDSASKVAAADTLEGAIEVRSLELAEAAGYPVNWPTE